MLRSTLAKIVKPLDGRSVILSPQKISDTSELLKDVPMGSSLSKITPNCYTKPQTTMRPHSKECIFWDDPDIGIACHF